MRRLVSPFILERFAAGESHGGFGAATVFVDVSGFSAMTSALMAHGQLGAEVGAQVMRALFTPLVDAVYAHHGFITGFAGDSFTAVFPEDSPSPDRVEDCPCELRALAAAQTMRGHLQHQPQHDTACGTFKVSIKIGLAAGRLQWGIVRLPDDRLVHARAAFYFRGPAIDACAAADAHTQPGELVLHPSCVPLLHKAVTAVPVTDGYARVVDVTVALPAPQRVCLAPVDRAALATFLPAEIIDQTEVGEFRQAINVFVNLQHDPDHEQIHELMAVMSELRARYGGQFNRIDFGDKGCNLLLFWGAPVSHEDDVERALNFVLELKSRAPLLIRAGVTSGISHAGFVGSDVHAEFTCYGQGLNLAARLMMSAPWGGIWLDAAVQRRAAARFSTEPVGDRAFKGFAEPQAVFELVESRPQVDVPNAGDMVGREAELQSLAAFVAPLHEGRGAGVMVVQGDAGMGKSRLVGEFLGRFAKGPAAPDLEAAGSVSQVRAFVAQTDSISRQPFNPFRYWLRHLFARDPRASDAQNKQTFDTYIDDLLAALLATDADADATDRALGRELKRVRSVLGALVDLHWEGSLYARLDPRGRYDNTLDAIATLLWAESRRQPVVLVLEDVHWLDEGSAQVIRRLMGGPRDKSTQRPGGYPLAVIATARPEAEPLFSGEVDHFSLTLGPFSRLELTALATRVLGGPPSPDLVDLLLARTDGNPFFAERVLSFLRDDDKLMFVGDRWTVNTVALAAAPLPADVRVIFVALLDRLGQAAKEVVQAASVLGKEFDLTVLGRLLQSTSLASATEAARAAGIWSPISATRWAFRHILLRDAAYDMQLQARRAHLHQAAATAIEAVWGSHLAPHYGEIGHHWETAFGFGMEAARQPAVTYLTKAGLQAAGSFASAAAGDLFTRALALTPQQDAPGRFELLLEREGVFDHQGNRAAQAQDVSALEALADQLGQAGRQAEAAMRRTYLSADLADFASALAASDRALAWARKAGLPALEAAALRTGGAALRIQGHFHEAMTRFEQAIAVSQSARIPYQEATAWTAWSSLAVRRGNWAPAVAALEGVVAMFEASGHVVRVAHTLHELGVALAAAGRLAEAQLRFEQALALTREIGYRAGQIPPLYNLPLVLIAKGDYCQAEVFAAEAIEIATEMRDAYMRTRGCMARARAALYSGDWTAAQGFLADAGQAADSAFPDLRGWVLAHRAALALTTGRRAEAASLAALAVELARAVDDRSDLCLGLVYQALAQEALGQLDAAEKSFRECIDLESATRAVAGRSWDCRAGLARLRLAQRRPDEALAEVEPIVAHLSALQQAGDPGDGLSPCEQPLRVALTVYQALSAASDPRSGPILEQAVAVLGSLVEQFGEPSHRQRFLTGIPYHRELLDAWRNQTGQGGLRDRAPGVHSASVSSRA